ncbi:MAG: hydrogenase-4 component G [Campylobacterota bacterium]|nr:hydrogenase-4 component G [Campylobacterota bacterium]
MININNTLAQNPYLKSGVDEQNHGKNQANDFEKTKEDNAVKQIEESAVKVSLSMNAQIVLFSMDANQLNSENITAQSWVFDFLSGKENQNGLSLENIGYEGKPITELSVDEANELLSDDGFFGIEQTSKRVSNFVLEFAKDKLELLKEGREGIVKGFEEAKKLWGGELPEISYETQAKTLEIIDAKIAEVEGTTEQKEMTEE